MTLIIFLGYWRKSTAV